VVIYRIKLHVVDY